MRKVIGLVLLGVPLGILTANIVSKVGWLEAAIIISASLVLTAMIAAGVFMLTSD